MRLTEPSYILAELDDYTSSWIRSLRSNYAPHAIEWPVDICLTGSSGTGTIKTGQDLDIIIDKASDILTPAKLKSFNFLGIRYFPNTGIHYLEPPNSEFDVLHEKLKNCGIHYEYNQWPYKPHCTISYSPEFSASVNEELASFDLPPEPVSIKYFAIYSLSNTGIASRLHVFR